MPVSTPPKVPTAHSQGLLEFYQELVAALDSALKLSEDSDTVIGVLLPRGIAEALHSTASETLKQWSANRG